MTRDISVLQSTLQSRRQSLGSLQIQCRRWPPRKCKARPEQISCLSRYIGHCQRKPVRRLHPGYRAKILLFSCCSNLCTFLKQQALQQSRCLCRNSDILRHHSSKGWSNKPQICPTLLTLTDLSELQFQCHRGHRHHSCNGHTNFDLSVYTRGRPWI